MQSPVYPDVEMKKIVKLGVEIEYCPKSGGVWLDRGELEKIIDLVKSSSNQSHIEDDAMAPQIDDDFNSKHNSHPTNHQNYHKKRENPLEELFDFF